MTEERPAGLIVGGASGIGEATAHTLVQRGWRVAIADINHELGNRVAEGLRARAGESEASAWRCDVREKESVDLTIKQVAESFGRLDSVIYSAGYADRMPSSEVTDDSLARMVDIQLMGAVRCARAAFPYLRDSERASVVAVSSINAHIGMPHRLAYSIAKAGLEAMVRTLAVEWAPVGIRVNAVAPSWVLTPMVQAGIDAGQLDVDELTPWLPLGRLAEVGEIAETIAFLASPAASYITGQSLLVDGAMTVRGPWPKGTRPLGGNPPE